MLRLAIVLSTVLLLLQTLTANVAATPMLANSHGVPPTNAYWSGSYVFLNCDPNNCCCFNSATIFTGTNSTLMITASQIGRPFCPGNFTFEMPLPEAPNAVTVISQYPDNFYSFNRTSSTSPIAVVPLDGSDPYCRAVGIPMMLPANWPLYWTGNFLFTGCNDTLCCCLTTAQFQKSALDPSMLVITANFLGRRCSSQSTTFTLNMMSISGPTVFLQTLDSSYTILRRVAETGSLVVSQMTIFTGATCSSTGMLVTPTPMNRSLSGGAIAGIVIGVMLVVAALVLLGVRKFSHKGAKLRGVSEEGVPLNLMSQSVYN